MKTDWSKVQLVRHDFKQTQKPNYEDAKYHVLEWAGNPPEPIEGHFYEDEFEQDLKEWELNNPEVWIDIKGYGGKYQVSSYGRIKSFYGKVNYLSPVSHHGYDKVTLCKNGSKKQLFVHRIVLASFIQENPNSLQVNHKDGVKTNNYLYNLEYCDSKQNINHAYENKLIRNIGEFNHNSKLSNHQVLEIRSSSLNVSELSRKYFVSRKTIQNILSRKSWKHLKD